MIAELWTECLADIFQDHGIEVPIEKIEAIAKDVKDAAENDISEYRPENPLIRENAELERKLKTEREKVTCRECNGHGVIEGVVGVSHFSLGRCDRCHGEGKHSL